MPTYDYIIIGAGASGLLLADALGSDSFFANKAILLLEKSAKNKNDRTWCFWEKGAGEFDGMLYKSWPNIHFEGNEIDVKPSIAPYRYKMIKGLDFYQSYFDKIKLYPNIKYVDDEVLTVEKKEGNAVVKGNKNDYTATYVFDSRFTYEKLKQQDKYPVLQQHFLGWFVKTDRFVFNSEMATFMDFSIPQKGNTRFMYILPFSETEALVEYTLFSEHVLEKEEYEKAVKAYLKDKLHIENFDITEVEQGNIPMTCFDFSKANSATFLKIGIAGGWAKASTGFTFYNSTKKIKKLVRFLKTGKPLTKFENKSRFWFYDLLFLDVLQQNNHLGSQVFEALFKKRSPQLVLKFLDEKTSILEELRVMWACPKGPFIKALFKRVLPFRT
jgi:lycopene beta-cyclase